MTVPNHAIAPIRQVRTLHGGQERVSPGLDGLCHQPAGAAPQNRRQRIVDRVGLAQGNNTATARHGVSAPSGVQAGLHPPRYAASLKPSSPRFGHSSRTSPLRASSSPATSVLASAARQRSSRCGQVRNHPGFGDLQASRRSAQRPSCKRSRQFSDRLMPSPHCRSAPVPC